MDVIAATERETEALGAAIAPLLFPTAFIALYGDLGAGKTVFARGLCEALGIRSVNSPTFTIVQEHEGSGMPIFHFDAYRLSSGDELFDIGFEDYLCRGGVILMEWPENVADALPGDRLEVRIAGSGGEPRHIAVRACGPRHGALMERLEGGRSCVF